MESVVACLHGAYLVRLLDLYYLSPSHPSDLYFMLILPHSFMQLHLPPALDFKRFPSPPLPPPLLETWPQDSAHEDLSSHLS